MKVCVNAMSNSKRNKNKMKLENLKQIGSESNSCKKRNTKIRMKKREGLSRVTELKISQKEYGERGRKL